MDPKQVLRDRYGRIAARVAARSDTTCRVPASGGAVGHPITANLYSGVEARGVPREALAASLGCGNPTALGELQPGETVLDLGSGGGVDCFLAARRVAPGGRVYGMDMTDAMIALARTNGGRHGGEAVEFLRGEMEAIPLLDESVDVVISNCVVHLSSDKTKAFSEAFRVLKPGGRLAVCDIVARSALPPDIRKSVGFWVGCLSGALEEAEWRSSLSLSGFECVNLEPLRRYSAQDLFGFLEEKGWNIEGIRGAVEDVFMSAFIRARKPQCL